MVHILLQQEGAFPVGKRLVSEVEKVYLNIIVAIIYVGFILTTDHIKDVQQYPTSAHIQQDSMEYPSRLSYRRYTLRIYAMDFISFLLKVT